MSRIGSPPRSGPVAVIVAVVAAFVIGLIGTAVGGAQLGGGRSDTGGFLLVGAVGSVCALIGAATRSRLAALVAGSVGLVAAVIVLDPGYQGSWLAWLWIVLGIPYLVGFGLALLLAEAFLGGLRRGPGYAALVGAVIVAIIGMGIAYIGPRLIEGPCMGTSIEQCADSYLGLVARMEYNSVPLDAQFRAAGQDARQVGAAYESAAVYDGDYTDAIRQLCFPAAVRPQVDALGDAVDARAQVHRLLSRDPFDPDLLAQRRSSQEKVTVAMAEVRRGLGLPPLSEPSAAPSR